MYFYWNKVVNCVIKLLSYTKSVLGSSITFQEYQSNTGEEHGRGAEFSEGQLVDVYSSNKEVLSAALSPVAG